MSGHVSAFLSHRSPFDKLRVNGGGIRNVKEAPFVLSLSKHEDT
jgi:hypothetical protein